MDLKTYARGKGWFRYEPQGNQVNVHCMFHNDREPSMTLYFYSNTFHCKGCGTTGDLPYLRSLLDYNLSPNASSEVRRKIVGSVLSEGYTKPIFTQPIITQKHYDALDTMYDVYHDYYDSLPATHAVKRYLTQRNIKLTNDLIGYSDGSTAFVELLRRLGEGGVSLLEDMRMLTKRGCEVHAGRATIFEKSTKVRFFQSRDITGMSTLRWHSPSLPKQIFGYERLKTVTQKVCIVEGLFDAIALEQEGYSAIALGGNKIAASSLTIMPYLQNLEVTIIPDNDKAGQEGLLYNLELMLKYGIKPKVIQLNGYKDVAEYNEKEDLCKLLK